MVERCDVGLLLGCGKRKREQEDDFGGVPLAEEPEASSSSSARSSCLADTASTKTRDSSPCASVPAAATAASAPPAPQCPLILLQLVRARAERLRGVPPERCAARAALLRIAQLIDDPEGHSLFMAMVSEACLRCTLDPELSAVARGDVAAAMRSLSAKFDLSGNMLRAARGALATMRQAHGEEHTAQMVRGHLRLRRCLRGLLLNQQQLGAAAAEPSAAAADQQQHEEEEGAAAAAPAADVAADVATSPSCGRAASPAAASARCPFAGLAGTSCGALAQAHLC